MTDVNAKLINNPTYNLIMYMNKYCEDKLTDKVIQLFGNLHTHFKKLFYTVGLIHEIQKNENFMKQYNQTGLIGIQNVEYCYYKISTIFDIAYQIADILIFPKKKETKDRYEYLEKKFVEYSNKLNHLNVEWYRNINTIRNKITHGGIRVTPFYIEKEGVVENRICFQVYNSDLDDLTIPNYFYTNKYNNINFADNYFAFYTHALYCYLCDFFDFIMLEIDVELKNGVDDLTLENDIMRFGESNKSWLLSGVDVFKNITKEMIALNKNEGRFSSNDMHINISDNLILNYEFFKMLHKTKNYWQPVTNEATK
jgi:hypothetical protein